MQILTPRRRSAALTAGLVLPLATASLSFVWSLVSVAAGVSNQMDNMQRVVCPGRHRIALEQPGEHVIYYENRSFVNGKRFSGPEEMPDFDCLVTDAATGREVPLTETSNAHYQANSCEGRSVCGFTTDHAGTFVLEARAAQEERPRPFVLSVGPRLFSGFPSLGRWLFVLVLNGATWVIGAVSLYVLLNRRRQAKLA